MLEQYAQAAVTVRLPDSLFRVLKYSSTHSLYSSFTVISGSRLYGSLLYRNNASYASLYVAKYASGFRSFPIIRPDSSFSTVTIALNGFLRFCPLISVILPKPFGNFFLLLRLVRFGVILVFLPTGHPQCGQASALSLTCKSHSLHFTSMTLSLPAKKPKNPITTRRITL